VQTQADVNPAADPLQNLESQRLRDARSRDTRERETR
jgi:hypothetical protein